MIEAAGLLKAYGHRLKEVPMSEVASNSIHEAMSSLRFKGRPFDSSRCADHSRIGGRKARKSRERNVRNDRLGQIRDFTKAIHLFDTRDDSDDDPEEE
jgi:hypothetical protein